MRAPHQRLRLTVLHNTHFPDAVHQLLGRVLVDISTKLGPSLDMILCDFVVVCLSLSACCLAWIATRPAVASTLGRGHPAQF